MPKAQLAVRKNTLHARAIWGRQCSGLLAKNLRELTMHTGVSVALGDVLLLDGKWYITHSGLLRLALTRGCKGINVCPVSSFCDASLSRWAFRATGLWKSCPSSGHLDCVGLVPNLLARQQDRVFRIVPIQKRGMFR